MVAVPTANQAEALDSERLREAAAEITFVLERFVYAALTQALDDEAEHLTAIRRFFLQPHELYSIDDLSALWRIHPDDVQDIYHDQVVRSTNPSSGTDSFRIAWADAVRTTVTFNIFRPFDIERALGSDFAHVQSEEWRTVPVLIHLPKLVTDAVARDASIPSNLPLAARIEQILLEIFTSGEYAAPLALDDRSVRRSV